MSFFSCFACGDSNNTNITNPTPINPVKIMPQEKLNISKMELGQEFEDNKSRSNTTMTYFTTDSFPSSIEDEESYIRKKIQQIRKKDLPERKAMESEFIKQNLTKSAVICLVEKEWSEQYTAFLKQIDVKELRSINNSRLFDNKNNLRTDIKQKEDYFIINQRVWKFVQQMYGGGPIIIQDSFFPVVSLMNRKFQMPIVGIVNPLNLCYMIAVMQCLFSNQHFSYYFLKKSFDDSKKKMIYHNILFRFAKAMADTNSSKIQIKELASYFQNTFDPSEQHDAHQFFINLCNVLQEEANLENGLKPIIAKDPEAAYTNYFKNNRSIIDKLFVGQCQTVLQCSRCPLKSTTYNPFIDIQLEIIDPSLQVCLKRHFEVQKIQDYECQKCSKKTKAFKRQFITKTPNYLILNLKKFEKTGKKKEQRVKYPQQLNLRQFCRGHYGQSRYALQSVLVHKGMRSTKGHYYCYTHRGKKWYYTSDDLVKEIEAQQILGRDGYILFYERVK